MKKLLMIGFMCSMNLGLTFAEVNMTISKESDGKIPVSLVKPSSGAALSSSFFKFMKKDLDLSGWIRWAGRQNEIDQISQEAIPGQVVSIQSWKNLGTQVLIKTGFNLSTGESGKFEIFVYHIESNTRIYAKRYQFQKGRLKSTVHVAVDDIIQKLTGEIGIATSKIAFVSDGANHTKEVYFFSYDGDDIKQVTQDRSLSLGPDWSPDGRSLIYTSFKDHFARVYQHQLYDGKRIQISAFPGLNASAKYSPDGEQIALVLSKDGNPELYIMDLNGKNVRRLTRKPGVDTSPSWSPDGEKIAFVSDRSGRPHIYIYHLSNKSVTRVSHSGRYNVSPDWSPKGDKIAYCSDQDGTFRIYVANLRNGNSEAVSPVGIHAEEPDWAPNNKHLVYSAKLGGRFALFVVDVDTGSVRKLISGKRNFLTPAWSS